jgi:RNA polymerase sigma-70 factor (ECF subfamily)
LPHRRGFRADVAMQDLTPPTRTRRRPAASCCQVSEIAQGLAGQVIAPDAQDALARDFEARIAESATLAVRVAYGVLRHQQDAEDVAQEAFARAFRKFMSLRDRDRFRAWLVRMTWRLALDHRRGQKRRALREESAASPEAGPDVEAMAISRQRAFNLWTAIDALPEKLRIVIVLAAIEEESVKRVSALLDIPEGTVKSRLFEARRVLQEKLR